MVGHGLVNTPDVPLLSFSPSPRQSNSTKPSNPPLQEPDAEVDAALKLGEELSERLSVAESEVPVPNASTGSSAGSQPSATASTGIPLPSKSSYVHPSNLSARLYSNPQLAALRAPIAIPLSPRVPPINTQSAPANSTILADPKCSGYFVKPVCSYYLFRSLSPAVRFTTELTV